MSITTNKEIKKKLPRRKSMVSPIIFLTLIFFLSQYAYKIYNYGSLLNNGEIYNFLNHEVLRSGVIDLSLLYAVFIQVLLITIYILLIWGTTRCIGVVFSLTCRKMRSWAILIWLIFTITICLAHEYFYPYSEFSLLRQLLENININITETQLKYAVITGAGLCSIVVLIALMGLITLSVRNFIKTTIILLILGCGGYFGWQKYYFAYNEVNSNQPKLPNIVLINLDGLSPKQLRISQPKKDLTPIINDFIDQSTLFTRNVTPSLQQFPTWISVLTGKYPNSTCVSANYTQVPNKIIEDNLIKIVNNKGYTSIYVSDSSQTVKLQQLKSFNKIYAPPSNFSNILVGQSNDLIISNLLINTPLGPYLFPANYANRDLAANYDPQTLITQLSKAIQENSANGLFLVVNMNLAQWPYGWQSAPSAKMPKDIKNNLENAKRYNRSLSELDKQFNNIMFLLSQKGILKNSLVIIFSNQTSKQITSGDTLIREDNYQGNNIEIVSKLTKNVNDHDYLTKAIHTVLAIRSLMDNKNNHMGPVTAVTSSIDIYATIKGFLGLHDHSSPSINLMPIVTGKANNLKARSIYFETDFNIDQLSLGAQNIETLLTKNVKNLNINCCSGDIELKPEILNLLKNKQAYGRINFPLIFLQMPENDITDGTLIYNIQSKTWSIKNQTETYNPTN